MWLIFICNLYLFVLLRTNEWSWKMLKRSTDSPAALTYKSSPKWYLCTMYEIIRLILFFISCFYSISNVRCFAIASAADHDTATVSESISVHGSVLLSQMVFLFLCSRHHSSRMLLLVTHFAHHLSICLLVFLFILRIFYAKSKIEFWLTFFFAISFYNVRRKRI